jgi:hypothetical protein
MSDCACIGVYRKERLDESYRGILRNYQRYVIEDTCWFSIELEWHMKPQYTEYEKEQLAEAFGAFPDQEILIFGECDRIFVAAYELMSHFGGLLRVNISTLKAKMKLYPGIKIPILKKRQKNPLMHRPNYWLVDQYFTKEFFNLDENPNFEKFKLDIFLFMA